MTYNVSSGTLSLYSTTTRYGRRARRHGQGGGFPLEMLKCFLLQMLSKTSVDEVFMHHFEKMSSASGGFAPRSPPGSGSCPSTLLGTSVLQTPSLLTPGKNPAGAHVVRRALLTTTVTHAILYDSVLCSSVLYYCLFEIACL